MLSTVEWINLKFSNGQFYNKIKSEDKSIHELFIIVIREKNSLDKNRMPKMYQFLAIKLNRNKNK